MRTLAAAALVATGIVMLSSCGAAQDGTGPAGRPSTTIPAGGHGGSTGTTGTTGTTLSGAASAHLEPGDGAPHEAENRGALQPCELSRTTAHDLELAADRVRPALDRLRMAGDFRPASTTAVFVRAGYPATDVQALPLSHVSSSSGPGVVFGVRTRGACLVGAVLPQRVEIQPRGVIAEWGCGTPNAH